MWFWEALDNIHLSAFRLISSVRTKWRRECFKSLSVTSERIGHIICRELQSSGQTQGMLHELKEPGPLCRGHEKDQRWVWMAIILPWANGCVACIEEFNWGFSPFTQVVLITAFLLCLKLRMTPVWTHQKIISPALSHALAQIWSSDAFYIFLTIQKKN